MVINLLSTPVAFIIFNRPDTTQKVFDAIARVRPSKLLVISDGPRSHMAGETHLVDQSRKIVESVDWDCEVLKNYSETNLGCKKRLSTGIDWVFANVTEAIILEDDCLPHDQFFQFCTEMLERYRSEKAVGMIGGVNFQGDRASFNASYYFSKYVHIWGWATWRDRWEKSYDVDIKEWPEIKKSGVLKALLPAMGEYRFWSKIFDSVYEGKVDTWDYQWLFTNWRLNRINILPSVNLVSNIGFGREDATHTREMSHMGNLSIADLKFPLAHPDVMLVNSSADKYSDFKCFRITIYKRILSKLFGIINVLHLKRFL